MNSILETIQQFGIVPVVRLEREEDAIPLATALSEGGLPVAEITFRTEVAAKCMKLITTEFPNMLIGAGTVLNGNQVEEALEAGAKFMVSPGLNPKTVHYCKEKGVLILPGCSNASDIEIAIDFGLEAVKFFPAEQAGGIAMIKALSAPYYTMLFMPTGGINENNLRQYLGFSKILACGGSWMVTNRLIENKDFSMIKTLAKQAVDMVKKIRGGE